MDSTQTYFGQWILQRPILGRGFYTDPFRAVDSTQTHFGPWILQRPILGSGLFTTLWKLHSFSITQILSEINLLGARCAKYAVLTYFKALNFELYNFFAVLEG